MKLKVRKSNQRASGGSYVVHYEADLDLLDVASVTVTIEAADPADADPQSIEIVREAIRRGAERILLPLSRGASIRVHHVVIHPTDFKPFRFEVCTADAVQRLLARSGSGQKTEEAVTPLLRDAGDADFDTILRLNRESEKYLSPLSRDRLEALSKEAAYLKVAERDGEVVAFLLAFREGAAYDSENYRWFDSRYETFLYIDRVVVSASLQGKGLGALLYEDLFRFAREHQVLQVTCEFDVEPPNLASARFHARFGFREVGSQWVGGAKKRVSLQEAKALPDLPRPMDVRDSYDSAAKAYAEHLATELDGKPLDRHLLNRFAEETRGRGLVADLGCGPGHVARYLQEQGVTILGIDLSPGMVQVATDLHPGIEFRVGDMNQLDLPDEGLAGIVAFYAIVHFGSAELDEIFEEMHRVLRPGGLALISFHIGNKLTHLDELFGSPVSLVFCFHTPDDVIKRLQAAQLDVIEHIERAPYGGEYPSQRCYLLVRAF